MMIGYPDVAMRQVNAFSLLRAYLVFRSFQIVGSRNGP
jgi:hypothetical protein